MKRIFLNRGGEQQVTKETKANPPLRVGRAFVLFVAFCSIPFELPPGSSRLFL
jgi:hypothetical protein